MYEMRIVAQVIFCKTKRVSATLSSCGRKVRGSDRSQRDSGRECATHESCNTAEVDEIVEDLGGGRSAGHIGKETKCSGENETVDGQAVLRALAENRRCLAVAFVTRMRQWCENSFSPSLRQCTDRPSRKEFGRRHRDPSCPH